MFKKLFISCLTNNFQRLQTNKAVVLCTNTTTETRPLQLSNRKRKNKESTNISTIPHETEKESNISKYLIENRIRAKYIEKTRRHLASHIHVYILTLKNNKKKSKPNKKELTPSHSHSHIFRWMFR
uniref:(northern house mosquito) hypothetical protein n=1 Tax=Culex pipiens TaxID=7175 RepID=A0A8D8MS75_CULPI